MKKQNNRGFSLVELLIAITILAIVVVPLLHVFLTSADTAAKSRRLRDANKAAQNAVELLQTNSLTTILGANNSAEQETWVHELFGAENALAEVVLDADNKDNGVRTLTLDNVQYGGSAYDLRVNFDPTAYQTAGDFNGTQLTQYTSMDAVYPVADEADGTELAAALTPNALNVRLKNRTVKLVISAAGDEDNPVVSVTATTTFQYTYTIENAATGTMQTMTHEMSTSSNLLPAGYTVASGSELSVYLFMNPGYTNTGRTNVLSSARMGDQDDIQIENRNNLPCKVFIIKENQNQAAERSTYKATVDLAENHTAWPEGEDGFVTRIYSNLAQSKTGMTLPQVRYQQRLNQTARGNKQMEVSTELVDQQIENRFYNVTVQVFDADTTDYNTSPLTTLQATKLQ